jgi:hypothetical protein
MLLRLRIRDPEIFRKLKPEESQGFAAIAELKAAQANVLASLQGQAPPSPPQEGQDHRARLEIYGSIVQLLQAVGQVSEQLNQLMEMQAALFQEEQQKKNPQAGSRVPRRGEGIRQFGQQSARNGGKSPLATLPS